MSHFFLSKAKRRTTREPLQVPEGLKTACKGREQAIRLAWSFELVDLSGCFGLRVPSMEHLILPFFSGLRLGPE
jgi:hypothetical protein